jgi:hypothetical protein
MVRKRTVFAVAALTLLVPVMFEVQVNPEFALPRTITRPDDAQEARYRQCVSEHTDRATREALRTADNPDVQSLMIRMRQTEAVSECRTRYPERQVQQRAPLRVNLFDLRWRF